MHWHKAHCKVTPVQRTLDKFYCPTSITKVIWTTIHGSAESLSQKRSTAATLCDSGFSTSIVCRQQQQQLQHPGHADHIIILQFIAATHRPTVGCSMTTHPIGHQSFRITPPYMSDIRVQGKPSLSSYARLREIHFTSLLLCSRERTVETCPRYCARPRLCYVRRYYIVLS